MAYINPIIFNMANNYKDEKSFWQCSSQVLNPTLTHIYYANALYIAFFKIRF